jgi:hypothetical protein
MSAAKGGTGVRAYPLRASREETHEAKTPGRRKNIIPPYRARRRVSRGKGVMRTPLPPSGRNGRPPPWLAGMARVETRQFALHTPTIGGRNLWRMAKEAISQPRTPGTASKTIEIDKTVAGQ